jgi:hypothetical protein
MVLDMALCTVREAIVRVRALDCAVRLVQDFFGLFEKRLDVLDELRLVAVVLRLSIEGFNVLHWASGRVSKATGLRRTTY